MLRHLAALLTLVLSAHPAAADEPGDFSFYVLSLSWSPSYCELRGAEADREQCRAAKPHGFIVHGLWPQRERGFPESCAATERTVPFPMIRALADIMPSQGLIRHEWRRHGTCSGLGQSDYFALLRKARQRVNIPAQFRRLAERRAVEPRALERAFTAANPGLRAEGIAVTCEGALLEDVRICLTKGLDFRACPEVDRRACRRARVELPPMGAD